MAQTYYNIESASKDFGDSLQQTTSILDSNETCHMTPDISDFVLGPLVKMDKYCEVSFEHYVTAEKTGKVQISIHYNNG